MRYRHLKRTVIAVLAAVAFVMMLAVIVRQVLESAPVRGAAIRILERAAAERGFDLTVDDLHWGLLPPRVILTGVGLTGPGLSGEIDSVEADLARLRVARRTVVLGTVAAEGVDVRLDGLPRKSLRRGPSLVRLAIRRLDLRDMRFAGRDLPGKVDVTLDGLSVAWASEAERPSGFVAVERARFKAGKMAPLTASVDARIAIDDGIRLPMFRITGSEYLVEGSGEIADGDVRLEVAGTANLDQLDAALRSGVRLRGGVEFSGRIDTGVDELVVLDVSSPRVAAARFPVQDLEGTLTVFRDSLQCSLRRATFSGGRISGRYRLDHLTGPTRPHSIRASGQGVAVAGLLRTLGVPDAGLAARMDVDADLAWEGKKVDRGRGEAVAVLRPATGELPVEGRLEVALTPDGLLRFVADNLAIGGSDVTWQGPLSVGSWQPNWLIRASEADLGEVVTLVNGFVETEVLPAWIDGTGDLQVSLSGPWNQLVVTARIDARPLELPPVVLDQFVSDATIADSRVRLGPTRFRIADGQGEVDGSVTWGPASGTEQLDLSIRGYRIPVTTVAGWVGAPAISDGALSFTGGLRGSLAAPRGSWAVGLDEIAVSGQRLGGGTATIDLADGRFDARGLTFENGLQGGAWWHPTDGGIGGRIDWPEMPLATLGDSVTRLAGDTARLTIDFERPRDGAVTGSIRASSSNASVEIDAAPESISYRMSAADALSAQGSLQRSADGALAGDGTIELRSAENLIRRLAPTSELPLAGTASGIFHVQWPPGDLPTAAGALENLDLQLEERPIRLIEPARFQLSAAGIRFDGVNVAIRDDELFFRLAADRTGTLSGNLAGTLDALLLRFLLPDWEPAGRATGVVELLGTVDRPLFEGIAEVHQVSFRLPDTQTIFSGIDGTVLLSSDDVTLDGVDFRFMQGRGRTSGRIGRRGDSIDFALDGTAESLRFSVLPDLVAQLSGSWRLLGPVDDLELSGDLTVDSASLRSKEDIASLLLKWFGGDPKPPAADGGIEVDIHVEADETIELRNPSLRLVGSAALQVSGTTGRPGLVGKLEFSEGGEVTLQTLRYEVERASFTFSDPEVIDPFIDIQARTWVQNYDVSLRITGTRGRLVPAVSSNPPLTEDQIYGLMALGRRSEAVGGTGAMGVGFASSILSGQLASEFDRRAGFSLPVDQVRVDPFAETETGETGGARITLVKQLTREWTVVLQSNLSGAQEPVFISRWYIAPGIFVEASQDIEGSYGIDLMLRRPY